MLLICCLLVLFIGVWLFSSKRKHLLITLLSLEFVVLGLFMMYFLYFSSVSLFFVLVYLTFTACEGALGLTILVSMSRSHGGDYFKSFHLDY